MALKQVVKIQLSYNIYYFSQNYELNFNISLRQQNLLGFLSKGLKVLILFM